MSQPIPIGAPRIDDEPAGLVVAPEVGSGITSVAAGLVHGGASGGCLEGSTGFVPLDLDGGQSAILAAGVAAVVASHRSGPTVVVEADMSPISRLRGPLDLAPGLGVEHVLADPARVASALQPAGSDVWVLPGEVPEGGLVSSALLAKLVNEISTSIGPVFVTLPSMVADSPAELLADACDRVVLVARVDRTRRDALAVATQRLGRDRITGVILIDRPTHVRGTRRRWLRDQATRLSRWTSEGPRGGRRR